MCSGGMTPGGATPAAASATPRSVASDASQPVTPARTPARDKLSINPDDDMYADGDINEHQQVTTEPLELTLCFLLAAMSTEAPITHFCSK